MRLPALAEQVVSTPARAARVPRRVLVVDDNIDAGEMLTEVLSRWGHRVTLATDGLHALELAAQLEPEIVLLDIGLPELDGYQVAARLREMPGLAATRIVAVTGYGQIEDIRKVRAAGFAAHLVKPIEMDVLRRMLDEPTTPACG